MTNWLGDYDAAELVDRERAISETTSGGGGGGGSRRFDCSALVPKCRALSDHSNRVNPLIHRG